jgi:hypothetical protein
MNCMMGAERSEWNFSLFFSFYSSAFSILSSSGEAETLEMKSIVPFFFQILVAKIIPATRPIKVIPMPIISLIVVGLEV